MKSYEAFLKYGLPFIGICFLAVTVTAIVLGVCCYEYYRSYGFVWKIGG